MKTPMTKHMLAATAALSICLGVRAGSKDWMVVDLKTQKKGGAEYSISQVCGLTGFSADTLRFHEKAWLLPGVRRRGGRRVYSEANLLAVKLIDFNL